MVAVMVTNDDVVEVIEVFSDRGGPCPICDEPLDRGLGFNDDWLAPQVNHLIGHGMRLLHIGQVTRTGSDELVQASTAVLGLVAEPD